MRPLPLSHLSNPAVKAARMAVAAGAIAGLAVLGACAGDSAKTVTAPQNPAAITTSSGGLSNAAKLTLCVSATSPAGTYTFVNSGYVQGGAPFNNPADAGGGPPPFLGSTVENAPDATPYTLAQGGCANVLTRTAASEFFPGALDPYSDVTTTYSSNTVGAVYNHTDCVLDEGITGVLVPTPDPCGTGNQATTAHINFAHGVLMTYDFTPGVQPLIPLFVIGDLVPWSIVAGAPIKGAKPKANNTVNFWGSQWWKNNPMSQFHSNGWPSFKGYASDVNLTPSAGNPCGTWISRVGNSPPPPQTIPDLVGIIITNNVVKVGPDLGGGIQEIIVVRSDGGYGPNPGHDGNGPVVSIQCSGAQ